MSTNESPKAGQTALPPFLDPAKMMEQFRVPGVDMQSLADAQRKNVEALMQANQQAYEGMQAMAARQAELMRAAAAAMQGAMQQMSGKDPSTMATTQAELARQTFEKALADMRELAEIMTKSQSRAYETLSKRFLEHVEELRTAAQPK